jgi:hypothetical protein
VPVKPRVRDFDELAVKPFLAAARFITGHEQYGFLLGIKRESHAPNPATRFETQLLHVVVLRPL